VRLKMLENNELDALLVTEPYATQAILAKNKVLFDTRKSDMQMGVFVFRTEGMDDKNRQHQMKVFQEGYNEACDSINKYGVRNYRDVIRKYCVVTEQTLKNLPDTLKFQHAAPPRQIDIERAQKWLSKK